MSEDRDDVSGSCAAVSYLNLSSVAILDVLAQQIGSLHMIELWVKVYINSSTRYEQIISKNYAVLFETTHHLIR